MRVLEVFLLAVLGCSLAEGRLVSKCELKEQLMMTIGELLEDHTVQNATEKLVAMIVCHAELGANFDTSAVSQLTPGTTSQTRRRRDATYEGFFGLANPEEPSVTIRPHTRQQRHARHAPLNIDEEVWTLYGLFQLSNHLVCSDGTTPSPNICGMDCNKLVNDNTCDDISCMRTICKHLIEKDLEETKELRRMIHLIFQDECHDKDPSEYFAECS